MTERLGKGEWTFEVHDNWAKVPDEIVLGDCAAVGVDSKDNVYAFNRGDHPVAVFDKDGDLLRTWGEGLFSRPHGVHVAPDDTIWLTDDGDHTVHLRRPGADDLGDSRQAGALYERRAVPPLYAYRAVAGG